MWQEFFRFDLRYQLRQPLLWLAALALAAMAFMASSNPAVQIGGAAVGNVHLNAPTMLAGRLGVLSMLSMLLVTVFIAGAVLRDVETGMADLLYATPLRKIDYLFGRFLAGFAACLVVFAAIVLAMMAGAHLAAIDPERIGAFSLLPYAWSFAVLVVPNLLFVAAFLMLLATVTRSMIAVYAGVVAFVVLWAAAQALGAANGSAGGGASLSVLLDPFGVRVLARLTRYFSSAQMNSELPPFSGLLLANRLLWSGIALAMLAATVALFKPQRAGTGKRRFGKARAQAAAPAANPRVHSARRVAPRFDAWTGAHQAWHLLRFDVRAVMRSLPFLVMLLLAVANFVANHSIGGMRFDSTPYPLTRLLLEDLAGSMNSVLVLVLLFYSGELVHRERQLKIADVVDATALPDWAPLVSKAGALVAVVLAFLGAGALAGIAMQLAEGGAPVELGLYVQGTLVNSAYFILAGLALLALQALANNKYAGYVLGVALMMSGSVLHLEHRLLNFASLPTLVYSDLNGYGHFLTGWSWFALYWGLVCAALLFLAQAFRVRGPGPGWRVRLRAGARGLRGGAGLGLALSVAACAAVGGWIFYNTNVLNHYESSEAALDRAADYEKRYRSFLDFANPSVTGVRADVAIYPAERRVTIAGTYQLRNQTGAPLDTLRIQLDPATSTTLSLPAHSIVSDDKRHGMRVVKLREALAPGASLPFGFTVEVRNPGFTNSGAPDAINHNGTMFTSESFFPTFGYVQARELEDKSERRRRGLGDVHRMPGLDDPSARKSNFWKLFGFDAGLVDFETTVSTSLDQVAIAPGELVNSWEKNGRRYYHYKMDQPILPFFVYQSGRWDVAHADWHGTPISVYYDRKHPWNVQSMVKGTQRALDYYTANFGPYPHKSVRITEFPLYLQYARSFPGLIPFSESLGFINDLRNPDGVDHVFYVTAHEMAHQWWGDQVIAANSQGAAMVTESVAEYAALMTLEKEYGAEKTRHILRFDLDQYLAGRGKELVAELPLVKVENQTYLSYRKGSLVFYRLREEIGEAAVNRALKRFVDAHRYQTGSYINSRDLVAALRLETPADKQELLTDLFERIVLYDNRVVAASAKQRADGQWDVSMQLHLAKLEADGKGKETARAYDEPVEIAVFGAKGGQLLREKRQLAGGETSVTVTVKEKPVEVGVDPYNLLIDKVAGDNRKAVSI